MSDGDRDFVSKKALVTGGSRGIGAAIAQSLRDDGWRVATLSRNATVVGRSPTPTRA